MMLLTAMPMRITRAMARAFDDLALGFERLFQVWQGEYGTVGAFCATNTNAVIAGAVGQSEIKTHGTIYQRRLQERLT